LSYRGAPIRILFAFDPKQQGVIILAGDKSGDKRWYTTNIPIAEKLYTKYLDKQKKAAEEKAKMESERMKKEKGR
jgi:hypothetical protein